MRNESRKKSILSVSKIAFGVTCVLLYVMETKAQIESRELSLQTKEFGLKFDFQACYRRCRSTRRPIRCTGTAYSDSKTYGSTARSKRQGPSQRRFWAIQPTTSGGYSPSSFYNEPTFRATFPNQNIDITEGSNTIGKQGNLANSQFEYHGKAIGTISFTEQQPSFPTFTSYNNENQQPNQFKSSFNYQQPSFEQQPINSLFKTGYTSNELPITPSQTGIRWLPNYHGDQFTDPHRIMETQALNEQFFRSIGNQLDVRDY